LLLAGATLGRALELREQVARPLASRVVMAVKERAQALFAEPTRVDRAGVARQERETDQTVEIAEEPDRARPEALELATQLVAQRDASLHEVLARAGQRPQRLGLVGVGLKHPGAVTRGARQLAQHARPKPS